ncbi:MAG: hypothetical protein Q9183_006540 [Haloplaca sp. 2 TL-2023]
MKCRSPSPHLPTDQLSSKLSTNAVHRFLYGGYDGNVGSKAIPFDEIYILSLPAFRWFKVDYPPQLPRNGHSCNSVGGSQIISIGGSDSNAQIGTGYIDAPLTASEPSPTPDDSSSSSSPSSSTNTGAIAGGVVGGVAAIAVVVAVAFFLYRRRRQQTAHSSGKELRGSTASPPEGDGFYATDQVQELSDKQEMPAEMEEARPEMANNEMRPEMGYDEVKGPSNKPMEMDAREGTKRSRL